MLQGHKPTPKILIADDDDVMRLMVKRMMEHDDYDILEATNGEECLKIFYEQMPEVILLDAMMPVMDGFTACERIQSSPDGKGTPILMITALDDNDSVDRAFEAGASDYLTKPIHWAVLRQRVRRLLKTKQLEHNLQQTIAQLDVLHRIDRELGYTLNLDRILNLAMDTAMRWSGASACVVGWIEEEMQQLKRLANIGGTELLAEPISQDYLKYSSQFIARIFKEEEEAQFYTNEIDSQTSQLIIPLIVQGKPVGLIGLDRVLTSTVNTESIEFLIQLASRTSAAIDKTRIYQDTENQAVRLDQLYDISATISSSLDLEEVVDSLTRGLTVLLNASSAFFCEYDPQKKSLTVHNQFVIEGMKDNLPDNNVTFHLTDDIPIHYLFEGPFNLDFGIPYTKENLQQSLASYHVQSSLIVPLIDEGTLMGITFVCESRFERHFLPNEITLARSLAAQAAVALKHAKLYQNIKELEQVKSEMIRMASHDLRNPLTQIMGYLGLLSKTLADKLSAQEITFMENAKRGTDRMDSLLTDILNLEKIESQRETSWQDVPIGSILDEVIDNLRAQAEFKNQDYIIEVADGDFVVKGSDTQLKQALTNFVGNAIKYTQEEGTIKVSSESKDSRFYFEVEDNGYGIPEDRQAHLFERFYRAHTPGTEHIEGTGLGLSLVKSVIERHGGEVWFQSEVGKGSTFGLWLPLIN